MLTADRATCIAFSDDDLPPEGSNHVRPLFIDVACLGRRVPSVLLDNGSALNVCPLVTAIALGFSPDDFGPSTQIVRAYDGTQRTVMGTLSTHVMIGPVSYSIVFQVLRIQSSFNLFLGRPWIHEAGAIPSSLHQKVKFIHEGRIIMIQSNRDIITSSEPVLHISHSEDDLHLTGFTFDEVQVVSLEDGSRDMVPMSFDQHSNTLVLNMMRGMSYLPGMGLGRRQQGPHEFTFTVDHDTPYGLDYIPTEADARYMSQLRRDRSECDSDTEDEKVTPISGSTELIDFGAPDQPREIKIGSSLSPGEKSRLIDLLRSYLDVFAWSYEDMSGLDPSIVKEEIRKQLSVGFLSVVEYPEWLVNVVPVPKKDSKVRVCVDFRDLNKASLARLIDICEPIFRLLRKNQSTVWNDDCQRAFERIKECLFSPPVLVPPTPGRPLLLYLSVSNMALRCMLAQLDDLGKESVIYYLSKRMLKYECKYIMIERLCLAVVWATRRLRHYMTEYFVLLVSRLDPLRYLFDRPVLTSGLMRWLVLLTEFDIHYVTQKSVKGSIVADHLASLPISNDRSVDDDFPNEQIISMTDITGWRFYFDGAANQSGFGIGILLISPQGLETALDLGIRQLEIHGDSNLVIKQTQGIWRTRDEKLKPYHAYLDLLIDRFDVLRYIHLPRAENQFADALATLASLIVIPAGVNVRPLLIETRSAPAYYCLIGEIEDQIELPWYHDIY
ncbi:hypothetical protein VitviT2T_018512 [Vitis vinifera]|uniref:Retrovirus-related Pol polyprotein from transposon 17.6 n=1 Tax=Vitis vinifera TaxID=29760 RepID=A0ABY9D026_VITVI|nr:hypothetical protein VitviT2T_018512 [Vitis vinifera]